MVETCQAERGTLAVCIREAQRTLAQSSKRLIESKIASLGVGNVGGIAPPVILRWCIHPEIRAGVLVACFLQGKRGGLCRDRGIEVCP